MATKVVDASAIGALIFGEPDADAIAERLSGAELLAPLLLPFEIASICLKKIRRHPTQRAALVEALRLVGRLPINLLDIDQGDVVELAERSALSTYDASYLWLAVRHGELVTLDKRLATAARKFVAV